MIKLSSTEAELKKSVSLEKNACISLSKLFRTGKMKTDIEFHVNGCYVLEYRST